MNTAPSTSTAAAATRFEASPVKVQETDLAPTLLADADHPRVRSLAARLVKDAVTEQEKADRLASFVSEHIALGMPSSGDGTSASRTLALGYGYATTRATLLVALARAAGIPARLHFARFDKSLYRELIPGWLYPLFPQTVAVAWAELKVNGHWQPRPDAGHDAEFVRGAYYHLRERGQTFGAGLVTDPARGRENWNEELAAHYPLVADDGTWRDAMDYLWSKNYPMSRSFAAVRWALSHWGREDFFTRANAIRMAARQYEKLLESA